MALGSTQPGIFPGGKGGRCLGLTTLPPSCADFLKFRSLNLLEPSEPGQACNGIVLSLPYTVLRAIIEFRISSYCKASYDIVYYYYPRYLLYAGYLHLYS